MPFLTRRVGATALLAGLLASVALATPAYSRVFIGFGFPFFVGPPAYYPPPVYYPPPSYYPAPPPAYYAPPPAQSYAPPAAQSPYGSQSCNAGAYICPMERPISSGASCYCRDNYGQRVWGHAT